MFCMNCGKSLSEGDLFCQSCGTKAWTKPEKAVQVESVEEKPVEPGVVSVVEEAPIAPEPVVIPVAEEVPIAPEPEVIPVVEEATVEPEPKVSPVEPVAMMETRENEFCTNCGARLPAESLFCLRCGAKIDSFEDVPSVEEPVEPGFTVAPTQTSEIADNEGKAEKVKKKSPKTDKKGKKKIAIIVAIVVALSLIAGAILIFFNETDPCDYCGKRIYTPRMFWIETVDGGYWVCGDCYYSDPENEAYWEAAKNPDGDNQNVVEDTDVNAPGDDTYDEGGNIEDTEVVTEEAPVTPEPETETPVPTKYEYSGQTFTFHSTIYMGDFTEDHSQDNLQFYEWVGDQIELEVEVYTIPEGFDYDDYMTILEDFYGDAVYTDSWSHSMATVPEAYNMSECWESNGIDVIMNTDNYLYVFQILTDNMEYQNELYNSIVNVEINE